MENRINIDLKQGSRKVELENGKIIVSAEVKIEGKDESLECYISTEGVVTFKDGLDVIPSGFLKDIKWAKEIEIQKSVCRIGKAAFSGSGIEKITFQPDSQLSSIGKYAFKGTNIKVLNLDQCSKLNELPSNCFEKCKSLKCVILPENLNNIAKNCFLECENLNKAYYIGKKRRITTGNNSINANLEHIEQSSIPDILKRDEFEETNIDGLPEKVTRNMPKKPSRVKTKSNNSNKRKDNSGTLEEKLKKLRHIEKGLDTSDIGRIIIKNGILRYVDRKGRVYEMPIAIIKGDAEIRRAIFDLYRKNNKERREK